MNNLPQQGLIRMETIARGGGLEHVMKTGFKPSARRARHQTISYPACRARHGVQHVCTFRVIFYGPRYCAVLMQSHSDDSQPFHILHRLRSPHNAQNSTSEHEWR